MIERITLFHSNDIHSCFSNWSQMVAYIKKHKDENTLYVDLGDHADRSHPLTEATVGKGNVELLNEAEVNYVTIGNNEGITFSKNQLESLYVDANFSVILANLFYPDGKRPTWMRPYVIHTMKSGLKIGITGLTAPFQEFYQELGWEVGSPKKILEQILPILRKEADIVVLLSHVGLFRDEELALAFEGIDIIIGAHTHHVLPQGKRILGTLIAQTGKHGANLGKITLDYDHNMNQVIQSEATLVDVETFTTDLVTDQRMNYLCQKAKQILSEPIVSIPARYPVHWQEEREITQILCDAIAEWCNEDIAMMNAGVLLESFEKGQLTKGDIHRICPHPINPCVVKLSGDELEKTIVRAFTIEMRNLQLKGFGFRGKILGRMIFTGIDISFNEDHSIDQICILGEKLNKARIYSMATLDMYTFGSLFPEIAQSKEKKYFMPEFLRDIFTWKLKKLWS